MRKKKRFSDDKEAMERLTQGIMVFWDLVDLGMTVSIGLPGEWKHSEDEAEVYARILAKQADSGNTAAVERVEKMLEYADYAKVAMLEVPRVMNTVTHIVENGFHMPFTRSGKEEKKNG